MGFSKAQERLKANSHTELKYQLREAADDARRANAAKTDFLRHIQAAGFRPAHPKTQIIRFQKTGIKITAVSFDKQLTAVFLCFHYTD